MQPSRRIPHERQVHRRLRQTESGGLLLLWGLTFGMTVLTLIIGYFPLFQTTVATGQRQFLIEQAQSLTDTGFEHAMWELNGHRSAFLTASTNGWTQIASPYTECDALDGQMNNAVFGMAVSNCYRLVPNVVAAGDNFGGNIGEYRVWVVNYGSSLTRIVSRGFVPNTAAPTATKTEINVVFMGW